MTTKEKYFRFHFIVGYTSGDAPYGIIYEEAIANGIVDSNDNH